MTAFRLFLGAFLVVLVVYTLAVIAEHGFILFETFFGDMMAMNWPGQFNLDFMGYLMLSAIWVLWRNQFSGASFGLAILAFFGGMSFLPVYLIYLSVKLDGDVAAMLLGEQRATG